MTAAELIGLRSKNGPVLPVHRWLLVNTSNVFSDILSSVPEENEIRMTEGSDELLILLRALYGHSLAPPVGLELEGEAITWQTVAKTANLADKYNVPRLLKSCANFMATSGTKCLENQPSVVGLRTAMRWLELAKRLGLEAVTQAVAGLLGRMFWAWNVKDKLKEVAGLMDSSSFLEVVSNITEKSGSPSPTASPPSRTTAENLEAARDQLQPHQVGPPRMYNLQLFTGGIEPLLGQAAHPLHTAAPLVPVNQGW